MANEKLICGVVCGICWLLVILIVLLLSIGTVEPIEYGIIYNAITKTVNTDNVYPGGWYFIGPINSFITFSSTKQNIDFTDYDGAQAKPILVKDSDGQEMRLSFSLQYILQQENVGKLYTDYKKDYEQTYISQIDYGVRKVIGNFDSTAFWKDRQGNAEKLRQDIDSRLQPLYANCVNLQIINVQLSPTREESLIKTQVTVQQSKTKKNEQKAKEIRSSIQVRQSEAQRNITQIKGGGAGAAKLINANAASQAARQVIDATAKAYQALDK